ncbi:MAG: hypothetical protein R6U85_06445 [Salinivirgaceae bacterium]
MRKIVFILFIGVFGISLQAQETTDEKKPFLIRPYIENGINFIRNDNLKEIYESQSMHHIGFGLQFGSPYNQKIVPYLQYAQSSMDIEKEIEPEEPQKYSMQNDQVSLGLIIHVKEVNGIYFRTKFAYSLSMIEESFNVVDNDSHGFQVGIGVEKEVLKSQRIYMDLTYNYQKTDNDGFKDFDATRLSFGFIL